MSWSKRKAGILGVAVAGILASLLPAVPAAQASVAPWTWTRVTNTVSVAATTSYTVRALCPSGYTAITGGLALPIASTLNPMGEYRQDDGSGSGWTVLFRNDSTSTGTATVVAECVETADLPPISYDIQVFNRDANGYASGEVGCPNAGEAVLTGGVDWSNGSTGKSMSASVPGWGETSWYGSGYNPVSGAQLAVEVYCVNPAYVPGYQQLEFTRTGEGNWADSITCPQGKRILNGGNLDYVNGSYPTLTKWTATFVHYGPSWSSTFRATCIDAGNPTVSLDYSSPGPSGSATSSSYANFTLSGTDQAGYPNTFKCSLNGAPATTCGANPGYGPLTTGSYQLVVTNTTPDGRSSGPIVYNWSVDGVAPRVTKPTLPRVTLAASTTASWTGSDQGTGVDHYVAAYDVIHTDGTSTGWIKPRAWADLTVTSVQTPDLAQGESVCLSVRAVDGVGRHSPWSSPACTSRPLDDRALAASAGWTRGTGSAYWLNTVTSTTASGQTLTRSNVHLNRVGVVATVCSSCGTVSVKVGTTTIGSINLNATSLANKTVKLLPTFADQTGSVTITSTSSGKQIAIDGLVALQSVSTKP